MLHEVLIALSGHPSPLFENKTHGQEEDFLLSPSERSLLQSLAQLSQLHTRLKQRLESIELKHASIICRATATSIHQTHLQRFQKKILDVESKILTKDATIVGAYDIVPLASVVSEFDDWQRLMKWYWETTCFISDHTSGQSPKLACPGTKLIDHLRSEMRTGYPEIEQAANELARVAESAWLRQVSAWLTYGSLPVFGAQDFFIQARIESDAATFVQDRSLLPAFVSAPTASAIFFIGKSIRQVQTHGKAAQLVRDETPSQVKEAEITTLHLKLLSSLSLPLLASQLSRIISEIKLSLSQNVLQYLLPISSTQQLLSCLQQFFLLSRGEFAIALIEEADNRLQARSQSVGRLKQQDPLRAMQTLSFKDGELHQTLQQVWKALSLKIVEGLDDDLEFARRHISLGLPKTPSRPSTSEGPNASNLVISPVAFNDLLFPTPTELRLNIVSPLDLFLSQQDVATYSLINAYLLAIRRAHMKLSELWRRSPVRRDQTGISRQVRQRKQKRTVATRKVWATCSAAIFLLSETAAFFEGEIIQGSCEHFSKWMKGPVEHSNRDHHPHSTLPSQKAAQRDPETLSSGHRVFLASLSYMLLLTDIAFTRGLRELLGNVDKLTAFFDRLIEVQQKLDLEVQADAFGAGVNEHILQDEQRVNLELDRARKKVDSDLRSVVHRLRMLDQERIGSSRYLELSTTDSGSFQGWREGGGVDRLLMKLDFGRMTVNEEGQEII